MSHSNPPPDPDIPMEDVDSSGSWAASPGPALQLSFAHCRDPRELVTLAGLEQNMEHYFKILFAESGGEWKQFVKEEAMDYLEAIRESSDLANSDIPLGQLESLRDQEDLLLSTYVQLLKISFRFRENRADQYLAFLRKFSAAEFRPSQDENDHLSFVARAFHREGRDGRKVAEQVFGEITQYYRSYTSGFYLAPYTSIVGPSGIGKSFVVQQIARGNHAYVIYASLAKKGSTSYPKRSPIADVIGAISDGEDMTFFFEALITIGLLWCRICHDKQKSPILLYELQTKEQFKEFQQLFSHQVTKFYEESRKKDSSTHRKPRIQSDSQEEPFDYQRYTSDMLSTMEAEFEPSFSKPLDSTKACSNYKMLDPSGQKRLRSDIHTPSILICLDEASQLFDPTIRPPEMKFLAFRRALRHQSMVKRRKDEKTFFGLLLDTSSKVSNISPPTSLDLSMRFGHPIELFPAIFKIDTLDIFLPHTAAGGFAGKRDTADIDSNSLFRMGRPLWGALMDYSGVEDLAMRKALGGRQWSLRGFTHELQPLTLITYRMDVHIVHQRLAQDLTAGYMRYIVDVSQDRTLLQTIQPSEPILAHVSAQRTFEYPTERLTMIRTLFQYVTKGYVNIGDAGETVASLILLFSFDRAHRRGEPKRIPLSGFLKALLPRTAFSEVEKCAVSDTETSGIWNTSVFFNHIIRLKDRPTDQTLRRAYRRGAAVLLPTGFKGMDILVPAFNEKPQ